MSFCKKFTLLVGILLFSYFSYSNTLDKSQYYGDGFTVSLENAKKNGDLKKLLQAIASKDQNVFEYSEARALLFEKIDLNQNNGNFFVKDVYCQKNYDHGVGPNQIPSDKELNVEHTWPQSRFTNNFPAKTQKSDLHHLYPADSLMNNKRASWKFGEVNGSSENLKCVESKLGKTSDGFRFEPPTHHKGNVARSLFYFSVRYQISIDPDEEAILRQWHKQDPVDEEEINRHEIIFQTQHNRNPFVDYPELVDDIQDF